MRIEIGKAVFKYWLRIYLDLYEFSFHLFFFFIKILPLLSSVTDLIPSLPPSAFLPFSWYYTESLHKTILTHNSLLFHCPEF
jgi:hypothetical protein